MACYLSDWIVFVIVVTCQEYDFQKTEEDTSTALALEKRKHS